MLKFSESAKNAQVLAIHYARKQGNSLAIEFMSSKIGISNAEEAEILTRAFWEIVDLAIEDNEKGLSVEGINDIEFWMHKLFNKVSGYMTLNGYEDQWDKITKEVKSE
ncbi:hypothetical protein BTA51_03195 [Hahella sp. CCB-MM4]|uniref:hypothetical protein n=1 Tax=Hahella sp. (strain CCB-MM4) TaxID=1926491 RepID=UPI000B9C2F00|nr:hypothetical protein [Hahella sp. CCB-MM4]OZG75397.1 hypothetical protein BTA51_03195 [Hahella sp. CCB-MM4]